MPRHPPRRRHLTTYSGEQKGSIGKWGQTEKLAPLTAAPTSRCADPPASSATNLMQALAHPGGDEDGRCCRVGDRDGRVLRPARHDATTQSHPRLIVATHRLLWRTTSSSSGPDRPAPSW